MVLVFLFVRKRPGISVFRHFLNLGKIELSVFLYSL